jgi:hypothetical protein
LNKQDIRLGSLNHHSLQSHRPLRSHLFTSHLDQDPSLYHITICFNILTVRSSKYPLIPSSTLDNQDRPEWGSIYPPYPSTPPCSQTPCLLGFTAPDRTLASQFEGDTLTHFVRMKVNSQYLSTSRNLLNKPTTVYKCCRESQ